MKKSMIFSTMFLLVLVVLAGCTKKEIPLKELVDSPEKYVNQSLAVRDGVVVNTKVLATNPLGWPIFNAVFVTPFPLSKEGVLASVFLVTYVGIYSPVQIGDIVEMAGELKVNNVNGELVYFFEASSQHALKKTGKVNLKDADFVRIIKETSNKQKS